MICGPIKMTFADDMMRRVVPVHLSMKTRWSFHRGHTGNLVTRSSNVISPTAVASICISAAQRWTDFLIQSHVKGKELFRHDLSLYWLNEIIQILKNALFPLAPEILVASPYSTSSYWAPHTGTRAYVPVCMHIQPHYIFTHTTCIHTRIYTHNRLLQTHYRMPFNVFN